MPAATPQDLARSLRDLRLALTAAHYPERDRVDMRSGIKTAGLPWRLVLLMPEGGIATPPGMTAQGYLGTTRTEACATLDAIATGLRMAAASA